MGSGARASAPASALRRVRSQPVLCNAHRPRVSFDLGTAAAAAITTEQQQQQQQQQQQGSRRAKAAEANSRTAPHALVALAVALLIGYGANSNNAPPPPGGGGLGAALGTTPRPGAGVVGALGGACGLGRYAAKKDLDLERFGGAWWEAGVAGGDAENVGCVALNVSVAAAGNKEEGAAREVRLDLDRDGYRSVGVGRADAADPAKLAVAFDGGNPEPLWVAATDYERYALVASCSSALGVHAERRFFLLSRAPGPLPLVTAGDALNAAASAGLPWDEFRYTPAGACAAA